MRYSLLINPFWSRCDSLTFFPQFIPTFGTLSSWLDLVLLFFIYAHVLWAHTITSPKCFTSINLSFLSCLGTLFIFFYQKADHLSVSVSFPFICSPPPLPSLCPFHNKPPVSHLSFWALRKPRSFLSRFTPQWTKASAALTHSSSS